MPVLSSLAILAIVLLIHILAKLSERFGTVIKMQPIYRYYYLAAGFIVVGFVSQILVVMPHLIPGLNLTWLASSWLLLLAYHLPLAIGVTISLIITWRYWSWLVTERDG